MAELSHREKELNAEKVPVEHRVGSVQNTGHRHHITILLVEDCQINQVIIRQFLSRQIFSVEVAENGKVGLEKFKVGHYDLVLMDMQMPEMDGFTSTRLMRSWEREQGRKMAPIIALTGSTEENDHKQFLEAGCTTFLGKSFGKAEWVRALRKAAQLLPESSAHELLADENFSVRVDSEIAPLIPQFLQDMRQRARTIMQAAECEDYKTACALAHQMTGVGGTYGFKAITEVSRVIERAAKMQKRVEVLQCAAKLESYLEHVEVVYA